MNRDKLAGNTTLEKPHAAQELPVWALRLLYRLHGLERGKVHTVHLIVPTRPGDEPQWSIATSAPLENVR